MQINT